MKSYFAPLLQLQRFFLPALIALLLWVWSLALVGRQKVLDPATFYPSEGDFRGVP